MTNRTRDRSSAEALQEALERREALLATGAEPSKAHASATHELAGEAATLFALAGALSEAAAPVPEPKHVDVFAERLRRAAADAKAPRTVLRSRWWQLPGLGMAAAAAAIAIFAGLLVPAFRSLPGDSLYSFKRASERSRLAIVGGSDEARLRIRLATLRFNEVEGLIERAEMSEAGPGLAAASAITNITDPRIAELIEQTLEEAKEQIEVAATILIAEPPDIQSLDDLVEVSQRGQQLAEDVAEELPAAIKPPVLSTVVTLARIEAKAKAKRTEVADSKPEPTPTPEPPKPCATPTPTPTPKPADEAGSSDAESAPSSTPTPEPTVTPEPTPCITPEPTPTPTASPTAAPTPVVTPAPSPTPSPARSAEPRRQRPESTSADPTPSGRPSWA